MEKATKGELQIKGWLVAIAITDAVIMSSSALEGNKVLAIVITTACWSYLFLFSRWFGDKVFFPVVERIRRD